MEQPESRRSVWRNRDYVILLSGQVVSFVGDQAQFLAMPLLVLAVSGSATQAGLVLGVETAAYLLFGLVAGALIDRWDRKRAMIWCESIRAVLIGSIVVASLLHDLTIAHLYGVALVSGILATIFEAGDGAALPNVVRPEQLSAALGYSQSVQNGVRIFGATLAGGLYALGRMVPFGVNAVSYALSALSLGFVRAKFQEERGEEDEPSHVIADIRKGLKWVWHQPVIRFLAFVEAADSIRYGAGYLLIIVLAKLAGAGTVGIGMVFSGAAIGALLGSLFSGKITDKYPVGRIAVVLLWVEAISFPLYAVAHSAIWIGVIAALESIVTPIYSVAISNYRLLITPDALRGRTNSAIYTLTSGAMTIGSVAGGTLIGVLGARKLVLILGGWLVLLAVLTTANRVVRQAAIPADEDEPQVAFGNAS